MDYFQTTPGRVLGIGLCLWMWKLIQPPKDALDVEYEQKLADTPDVSAPNTYIPRFDPAQLTPFIFGHGLYPTIADFSHQALPKPRKPSPPERGVVYSLRKVFPHVVLLTFFWLMSPSWLQTYFLGFVSAILPGNVFRIVHWSLLTYNGTPIRPLFKFVNPHFPAPMLTYLYYWRPVGGALPRLGFPSTILLHCIGNVNLDRRLLLYVDILTFDFFIEFAMCCLVVGILLIKPLYCSRLFVMQFFLLFARRFLMDLAAGWLEASASRWLEGKLLGH